MSVVVWCRNQKIYNFGSFRFDEADVVVWCRNQKIYNNTTYDNLLSEVVVWCRNQKIYNRKRGLNDEQIVVVWCRNQKIYNFTTSRQATRWVVVWCRNQKIYNIEVYGWCELMLWFDVGIKRYTTILETALCLICCGLMYESKDIQHIGWCQHSSDSCGLM